LCDLIEHNPDPIVYTLIISRKIMTLCVTPAAYTQISQ
jgi:hypothetical protein